MKDRIIHVDFLRLGKDARIVVEIPVHFKNQEVAPGLKAGGTLNIVSHSVNLYCPADFIPDDIMVDLTGMQIGQNIHLSDIKLPYGAPPSATRENVTLVTLSSKAKEEEAPAEAVAAEVPATAQKAPASSLGAPLLRPRVPPPPRVQRLPPLPPRRRRSNATFGREAPMFLFAGLGNPGTVEHAHNRHNIGFMAVDEIVRRHSFSPWRKKFQSEMSEGTLAGEKVLVPKPQTYMNESGRAVGEAVRFHNIPWTQVYVLPPTSLTLIRQAARERRAAGLRATTASARSPPTSARTTSACASASVIPV